MVGNCVVVPRPFVHCTTEQGRMFVPVTINVAPASPAVADAGDTVAIVGTASGPDEIVKGKVLDKIAPLDTPMVTAPVETISEAGTIAVSCVELTNVVARTEGVCGVVYHSTTELPTKLVPFTVIVTGETPQEGVVEDEKDVTAGGTIVNGMVTEAPPPGPRVSTST